MLGATEQPAAPIASEADEPATEAEKPAKPDRPAEPDRPERAVEPSGAGEPQNATRVEKPQSYGGVTWYVPPGGMVPLRRGMRWDLNVDLSIGRVFAPSGGRWLGAARVRAGLLFIMEPLFPAVGLTAEVTTLQPARFGVQLESLHLWSGLWMQLGADYDTKARLAFHGAVGHDLLGIEVQSRKHESGDYVWSVFGKVRIPLGIIGMELASSKALERSKKK
jgi:hypothetical protein